MLLVLCGAALTVALIQGGSLLPALVLLLVFLVLAGVHSPLAFPRPVSAQEAQRRSALDGRPIVYWRAGCMFCLRLRFRLGGAAREVHWVDIWRDPDAASVVRAANGGDETVPTVVVAGQPHVNPDPEWVRAQLSPSA